MPTVPGELSDDDVFGTPIEAAKPAPSGELSDAEVFGPARAGLQDQVRASARLGLPRNPQAVIEAEALSGRYGMPADVAERNLDEVRAQAQADDLAGLAERNEALASWFAEDPANVAVAKDDAGVLAEIGDYFLGRLKLEQERAAVGGLVSSIGAGIAGVGSLVDAGARTADRGFRAIVGDDIADMMWFDGPRYANPTNILQDVGGGLEDVARAGAPAPGGIVNDVMAGLGQVAGQAAVTIANPAAGLTLMAGQGAEVQADRAREAGTYGSGAADAATGLGGAITAVTERLGLGWLMRRLPEPVRATLTKRVADIVLSGAGEAAQEVTEGVLQNAVTQAMIDPDFELFSGLGQDATVAGTVGLIFRSMLHLGQQRGDAEQAKRDGAQLEELGKLVDKTQLATTDPARLQAVLGKLKGAGWSDVWVPVEQFQTLFQSPTEADDARRRAGISSEEYAAALLGGPGAKVRIPTEGFFAGLDQAKRAALYPHARRTADGMTPEAAESYDPEAELGEYMAAIGEPGRPAGDPSNRVYEDMRLQLERAGASPDVAAAQAEQFAAFVRTQAERTGADVGAIADRVQVQGPLDPRLAEVLRGRDVDTSIDPILDAIRSGRTFTDAEVRGGRLVSGLVAAGGINPEATGAGDLRAMDAGQRPGLFNLAGMSLDDALVWARENGFIDKPLTQEQDAYDSNAPDISDLIEMIRDDLSGIAPVFASGELNVDREAFNQATESLQELMAERGIGPEELAALSNAQVRERLGLTGQQAEVEAFYQGTQAPTYKIKPPKKLYRGVTESEGKVTGYGAFMLGKGIYSSRDKSFAAKYGNKVITLTPEQAWPRNPLVLPNGRGSAPSVFLDWALDQTGLKNAREFFAAYPDPGVLVREKGFDGVIGGDEIVWYGEPAATDNGGTPDPSNPSILFQSEVPPEFQAADRTRKFKRGETTITYSSDGQTVTAHLIHTPKAARGKGGARAAFKAFLDKTDAAGLPVEGAIAEQDAATDGDKLWQFYRSLGFKKTGQTADGSPTIRRDPGGAPAAPRGAVTDKRGSLTITPERQFLIRIGEAADFSTFLHESGHFFLEVMREIDADLRARDPASLTPLQKQALKDNDALLKWMGVGSFAEIGTEQHEQFAETYEAYLREGRAPSPRLERAFQKFGTWLRMIYRTLLGLPRVKLSDEVRSIMDRMLATDAEIAAARQQQGLQALLTDQALSGMTPEEHARYLEAARVAHDDAVAAEAAEQYRYERQLARRWKTQEMRRLEREAQAAVDARPDVRAKYLLMRGTLPDGSPLPADQRPFKLNTAVVTDRYGKEWVKKNLSFMTANDGVHPNLAAQVLGFKDADTLLQAIAALPPRRDLIRAEAETRWATEHPDPMLDGDVAERVQRHVHNEAAAEVLAREIDQLSVLAGKPGKRPAVAAMRAAAERIVGSTVVANLAPSQYRYAEAKAGREAITAAAKQDWEGALKARRQQIWSGLMYRAALDAKERAEESRDLMVRLAKKPAQERFARAGWEHYLERINDILNAYDVRRLSLRELQRRTSMRSWVDARQADGDVTAIPEALIAKVEGNRVSNWREVTVGELDAAADALRNIEHLAGLKNKLTAAARKADRDQAVGELVARAEEALPDRVAQPVSEADLSLRQRAGRRLAAMRDDLTRPENMIEALDGGESGPWHDFVWHAMNQAEVKITDLRRDLAGRLRAIREQAPEDVLARLADPVTVLGLPTTRGTLISMVLNTGNAGNLQRLRDGGIEFNGRRVRLSDQQIAELRGMLTPAELDYVQGLWDAVGSLWGDIVALQRRMSGLPPERVEAQEFEANGKTYRGGYWPLAYDRNRSAVGETQAGDDALRIMMSQGFTRAATPKGYQKARVDEVEAPLQLDFAAVLAKHLDQVMTDLAYREAVRDVVGLLRDERVKEAILSRLGRPAYDSLQGMVSYAVSGSSSVAGQVARSWQRMADGVLSNMTVSALAIRPDIALGNYTSAMVQGLDRVGVRALMRGLWRLYTPGRGELTEEIKALSPFMRERLEDNDRLYRQELQRTARKRGFGEAYKRVMFTLHRAADHEVTRALWWGRFQMAIDAGETQAEAVRLADKAVRQTQTATGRKDLSTFERDPAFRQSRQFMGPMFVIFGRMMAAARGQGATSTVGARAATVMLQVFLAPALFALMAGRWANDGDDEDDEVGPGEWAMWLAANTLLFPVQTLPMLRDAGAAAEAIVTGNPVNARAAPLAGAIAGMAKAGRSLWDNAADDDGDGELDYLEATRDLAALAAPMTGVPASQARITTRTLEYFRDNPEAGADEFARVAVYGPPRK